MTMPMLPLARLLRRPALVLLSAALLVAGLLHVTSRTAAADSPPGRVFSTFGANGVSIGATEAQRAAVEAMEDEIVANLATFHGVQNDDRVRGFLRAEIRAALWLKFAKVIQLPEAERTPQEANVFGFLQAMVKGYRVAMATKARDEYHRWQQQVCSGYVPPSPFSYFGGCGEGFGTLTNPVSNPPSFDEFQQYGSVIVLDHVTNPANGHLSAAAGQAIGLYAGIAATLGGAAIGAAIGGIPAVGAAFAGVIAPYAVTLGTAAAFSAAAIAGIFATIILAVVIGVLQGIQVFQALELPGKLDAAVNAAGATPDLGAMLGSDNDKKSFFLMFMEQTLPDNAGSFTLPTMSQPGKGFFKLGTQGSSTFSDVDFAVIQGQHSFNYHQFVWLRDGWFVVEKPDGDGWEYSTYVEYIDWGGHYWRSSMLADGRFLHQQRINGEYSRDCSNDDNCYVSDEIHYAQVDFEEESLAFRKLKRNQPPTIAITDPPNNKEGRFTTLHAVVNDPEGDALTVSWHAPLPCLPGSILCGALTEPPSIDVTGNDSDVVFPQDGTYAVTGTVDDGKGNKRSVTRNITIENEAPALTLTTPTTNRTFDEGSGLTIAGTVDDPGTYDVLRLNINWGDGTFSQRTWDPARNSVFPVGDLYGREGDEPFSFTHVYPDDVAGADSQYLVRASLADDGGAIDHMSAFFVLVENEAPSTIVSLPVFEPEGHEFSLGGTVNEPGTDPVQMDIHWGDGVTTIITIPANATAPKTWSTKHTYADDGEYDVTLDMDDGDGGTFHVEGTITAQNADPTVDIQPFGDYVVGQPVTANLSFDDPGPVDTRTATFDWGDGSAVANLGTVADSASPTYTYLNAGEYPVEAAVTDDDGGTGGDTSSVVVGRGRTTTSAVSSSAASSTSGQSVTFATTVAPITFSGWSSPVPTGLVDFYDGTTYLGTGALDASGVARHTRSNLSVGTHTITAYYNGSNNYLTSNSSAAALTQRVGYGIKLLYDASKGVKAGAVLPVKVSLVGSVGNNLSSRTIALTVTGISPVVGGNPVPSGPFEFIASLDKTGGYQFSFKTKGMARGTYNLRFTVSGDPVVRQAPFTIL